jgi:hypothetical protein
MATVNPARLLGIKEADLADHADEVKFRFTDGRIEIVETRFSGRVVFAK